MKIDKNSRGTIALVYLFCIVVSALLIMFVHIPWLVWGIVAGMLWVCVWQLFFFRVPSRETTADGNKVCSVADGKVVILQKAVEKEFLKRECEKSIREEVTRDCRKGCNGCGLQRWEGVCECYENARRV